MIRHAAAAMIVCLGPAIASHAATIRGDYLEARTSDVWTGPCFANGEVNLVGKEATIAWRVVEGTWDGVPLDGLAVVAVVKTETTLGDPYAPPGEIHARLFVDDRADPDQRRALAGLAREVAGDLVASAGAPEPVPIAMEADPSTGAGWVRAGELSEIRTRGLCHHDRHCGNEEVYYPPLTDVVDPRPAVALVHAFRGSGLGTMWSSSDKRSAFVARFER